MPKGYYFYADPELRQPIRGPIRAGNPNVKYLQHYANYLELKFIVSRTDGLDKFQANKELEICETKLEWWSKRPGFSLKECLPEITKLKRMWEMSDTPDRWSR